MRGLMNVIHNIPMSATIPDPVSNESRT